MAGASEGDSGARVVPRVVAAAPWVVVLLGVLTLIVIMVVALLSFRAPERAPLSSAPPLVLPTPLASTTSDATTARPTPAGERSVRATPARTTRTAASPPASRSARPSPSATPQLLLAPGAPDGGAVTARYRLEEDGSRSFEAELLVRNDTAAARDWRVELSYGDDVRALWAYAASGVSVSTEGAGAYVLHSTGPLAVGASTAVSVWVSREGGESRPERCTVNGGDCVIG